jgi:Lon protease-like protein
MTLKYEQERKTAVESKLVTNICVMDHWEAAGVPSLKDDQRKTKSLPGSRLLATYLLAEAGELDYNAEVSFTGPEDEADSSLDAALLAGIKDSVRVELDCQVCYALFYDGVTTPCGHTFCRVCLQRVLDHANHCPVCRRTLTIQPVSNRAATPTNDVLWNMTTTFWSDQLEVRRQAILREGFGEEDQEFDIPVFVCTLSFPSMPTFLHVFEPRYRLMIRRALEGDRTFGMVLYQNDSFVELGTLLRIVNIEFFPDGRSLLETIGVSRFRILRHGIVDGYTVAKIDRINDISIADEEDLEARETAAQSTTADTSSLAHAGGGAPAPPPSTSRFPRTRDDVDGLATQALMDFATDFVARMRARSVRWLTARILAIYGECPADPAVFPWWFARVLPLHEMERYRLLSTTSVRERLKICCGWIIEWETSESRW